MPLNMPESVLVKFKGKLQKGITLRDLVNAIPYYAIKQGLLTVEKQNKKNIFAGKVIEIEGLESLKAEQAFELSDSSAERSAAACVVNLDKVPVVEYIKSNIVTNDNIEYQINRLSELTKSVIEKKKTCEDEIRRFVNVNFKCGNEFEKDKNQSGINLNNAMRDFIIAIQTAFFKNL